MSDRRDDQAEDFSSREKAAIVETIRPTILRRLTLMSTSATLTPSDGEADVVNCFFSWPSWPRVSARSSSALAQRDPIRPYEPKEVENEQ